MNGWCPFLAAADRQPSPNFTAGRNGLAVKATVIHIAEGGFQGSIDWMKQVGTSAHFIIAKDGRIAQLVSINDTAYGNGLSYINGHWIDPDGHVVNPAWPGLVPGVNPNYQTISIEHQGFSGEPWTPEMSAADGRLLQWLREETKLIWTPRQTLIGHYEISPISRANCPGKGVKWDDLAARGNMSTTVDWAKEWGTVAPYNSGWGIPTAWRSTYAAGKPLGACMSVELYNDSDLVMQEFKFGWVSYRRSTGQTQVLR